MTKRKIALIGNPNVGKSVLFACLTGTYVTVSNYPGTTVEVTRGQASIGGRPCEVIDTPGLYSIYPVTEDERVALRIIEGEPLDLIVHVIDAKHLERSLPLTLQLRERGLPLVLVLNLYDEAQRKGIGVGLKKLSQELSLPAVATVAVARRGSSGSQRPSMRPARGRFPRNPARRSRPSPRGSCAAGTRSPA